MENRNSPSFEYLRRRPDDSGDGCYTSTHSMTSTVGADMSSLDSLSSISSRRSTTSTNLHITSESSNDISVAPPYCQNEINNRASSDRNENRLSTRIDSTTSSPSDAQLPLHTESALSAELPDGSETNHGVQCAERGPVYNEQVQGVILGRISPRCESSRRQSSIVLPETIAIVATVACDADNEMLPLAAAVLLCDTISIASEYENNEFIRSTCLTPIPEDSSTTSRDQSSNDSFIIANTHDRHENLTGATKASEDPIRSLQRRREEKRFFIKVIGLAIGLNTLLAIAVVTVGICGSGACQQPLHSLPTVRKSVAPSVSPLGDLQRSEFPSNVPHSQSPSGTNSSENLFETDVSTSSPGGSFADLRTPPSIAPSVSQDIAEPQPESNVNMKQNDAAIQMLGLVGMTLALEVLILSGLYFYCSRWEGKRSAALLDANAYHFTASPSSSTVSQAA